MASGASKATAPAEPLKKSTNMPLSSETVEDSEDSDEDAADLEKQIAQYEAKESVKKTTVDSSSEED